MFESILNNVSRFITLTQEERVIFESLLKVKKLRKHQYLLQEGDLCRYESFINKGCTRSYYVDAKGNEHIGMFGVEDWWIGDLHSFLTESPSRYNIQAEEATELLCLDRPSLEKLYEHVPKFERFFRILIQHAFIAQQERIISSISQSAEERYAEFSRRYPKFEERFPQYQIASYLGITAESLSRIRRQQTRRSRS